MAGGREGKEVSWASGKLFPFSCFSFCCCFQWQRLAMWFSSIPHRVP